MWLTVRKLKCTKRGARGRGWDWLVSKAPTPLLSVWRFPELLGLVEQDYSTYGATERKIQGNLGEGSYIVDARSILVWGLIDPPTNHEARRALSPCDSQLGPCPQYDSTVDGLSSAANSTAVLRAPYCRTVRRLFLFARSTWSSVLGKGTLGPGRATRTEKVKNFACRGCIIQPRYAFFFCPLKKTTPLLLHVESPSLSPSNWLLGFVPKLNRLFSC